MRPRSRFSSRGPPHFRGGACESRRPRWKEWTTRSLVGTRWVQHFVSKACDPAGLLQESLGAFPDTPFWRKLPQTPPIFGDTFYPRTLRDTSGRKAREIPVAGRGKSQLLKMGSILVTSSQDSSALGYREFTQEGAMTISPFAAREGTSAPQWPKRKKMLSSPRSVQWLLRPVIRGAESHLRLPERGINLCGGPVTSGNVRGLLWLHWPGTE